MGIFRRIKHSRILSRQTISEAAVILTVVTLLSKIVGYLRTVLVAYYFGATAQVDAFVVAMLIPSLVLGIIAGGLQAVIVPVYTEKKHKNAEKAKVFVNQIFLINLVTLFILSALMILFPGFFVKIVAYGFKGERLTLAAHFLRFLVIYGFLSIFIGFFMGIFQSEKQFLYPALVTLTANLLVPISLFLLTPKLGINSWTVGEISFGVFGFSAMFLFLFYRKGFFRSFEINCIKWEEIRRFFALLLPIIFTSGVGAIYKIVDKAVASSLQTGAVAALNFAQLIYTLPYGLLAVPIVIAVYPTLSSLLVNENKESYDMVVNRTFSLLVFIMFPIASLFMVYSGIIVKLLYQHGAFTSEATSLTAFAVSMYSVGVITLSLNLLFQRIFFSHKDTKTPLYLTGTVVILNTTGDVLLAKVWGVGGIGLATTLSSICGSLLYVFSLRRKKFLNDYQAGFMRKEVFKVGLSSLILLLFAIPLKKLLLKQTGFFILLTRFVGVSAILFGIYILLNFFVKSYGMEVFKKYFIKTVKILKRP